MDFKDVYEIKDEALQVSKIYEIFNEDTRLSHSKAARVEFLTTVRYIEKYLKPGVRILDIGAGAGEYSLYFAAKGYEVSAVELAENNIRAFREKIWPEYAIDLRQGNALDLSCYDDKSFDIVFVFGPLYHLHSEADRSKCISEAKRVCKDKGMMFFAFISNDMVILTELGYNGNYFREEDYDHETFKLKDFPFVFFTAEQCRRMLFNGGIQIIHEVASDGVSELMAEKINGMDDESYEQYLKYHYYVCEKPEMFGHSNHWLFAGRKAEPQLLLPGERLDDLERNGYKIIQNPSKFCFGMDAVLLSGFARVGKGETAIDLGTGTGIIPILLEAKTSGTHFTGLEIQEESADMARRSVAYNHLEEKIDIVTGDLCRAPELFGRGKFDVVTSNPPYMNDMHGLKNPSDAKAIARHEVKCTLDDVAASASALLKTGGRFYLVHRPFRLVEIFAALTKYHLEPKRMRMVHPFADKEPNMVLIEAVRGGKSMIKVEKPLIVYEKPGVYMPEIYEVYGY